jgi:hypothetical protein
MSRGDFRYVLDSLPPKSPRSRLEPYGDLIHKLRRRGRTYREIVDILAAQCALRVSMSTLHDFVRLQSILERRRKHRKAAKPNRGDQVIPTRTMARVDQGSPAPDEIQERISDLRPTLNSSGVEPSSESFDYDPDEPLRLPLSVRREQSR